MGNDLEGPEAAQPQHKPPPALYSNFPNLYLPTALRINQAIVLMGFLLFRESCKPIEKALPSLNIYPRLVELLASIIVGTPHLVSSSRGLVASAP
ncbi:MAG: hypothetical protein AT710_09015 [Thermocladium sp. ECH_B]|nr:MAG: hypothetical protein AT710_09015 [Thermocladium sp. ECH_B]